jgi:fructokinase
VPAFTVDTVDATGCGDAFIAGLLWQFISRGNWRDQLSVERMHEVLHFANAVGALTAKKLGVIPSLPTAAAVDEFLSYSV